MKKHDFTEVQLKEIFALLTHLQDSNKNDTGYKYDALRYFKSKDGLFFVSYYRHGADTNGAVSECMYMRIDRNGDLVNIGEKYTKKYGVSRFFDKLEMITF